MLNRLTRWLLASILISGAVAIPTATNAAPGEQRWVPGQILVAPRAGVGPANFEALLQRHGGHSKGRLGPLDVHIVSVPVQAEAAVAAALARNPGIRFAELDLLVRPDITSATISTIPMPGTWRRLTPRQPGTTRRATASLWLFSIPAWMPRIRIYRDNWFPAGICMTTIRTPPMCMVMEPR